MAKRLNDFVDVKTAVVNSTTDGALVGVAVDCTGYSRARFIFNFGEGSATTAAVSGNIGIYQASTSGATFSAISSASLATRSSGIISATNINCVVEVPLDATYPWLKVSGNISSTSLRHSCVVELYDGINRPPSSSANQLVTV